MHWSQLGAPMIPHLHACDVSLLVYIRSEDVGHDAHVSQFLDMCKMGLDDAVGDLLIRGWIQLVCACVRH